MNRHRRFRFLCTLPVLLLFIAGGVAACSATNVSSGPTAAKCQVTVGALGPVVASGGTASVPVTAPQECGWDATTPATWITGLAPSSGQGTAMLEFQVAPNPAPIAREADVLINQERVHVSQDAAPCVYSIAPNDQTIPAAGGAGTINVTTLTGCSWNGVADVGWITITGAASGMGNGTIRFSAAPNGGAQKAGPGMVASFVVAGFVCAVAALCYSELASMVPVAGSAYTYTYAVVGELMHGKQLLQASKVGVATWMGLIFGTALKVAVAFAMLAIFALALLI